MTIPCVPKVMQKAMGKPSTIPVQLEKTFLNEAISTRNGIACAVCDSRAVLAQTGIDQDDQRMFVELIRTGTRRNQPCYTRDE